MGTQRVQMKRVLPWLVRWACRAGTIDFYHALAALVGPVHYFFHNIYYLNSFVPIAQQAGQAGSRAGSSVSEYVSLVKIDQEL
jgi:hypothetical protein